MSSSSSSIWQHWLALDKRSLGLFRICLGLILTVDILVRATHFCSHYTQSGFFPLDQYLYQPDITYRRWSLLYINDTPLFVGLFFAFFLFSALSLTVGYRTRVAGWICWACVLSVFRRNPVVNNSGDVYLPLLLMWANFLPWGERFSLDQDRDEESDGNLYSRFPGFCYLAQVGILYWFSAVLRVGKEWQGDDSALYYALNLDNYQTALAPYMLTLGAEPLALLTWLTLFLEIFGPVLLLLPSQWARLASVLLIISFHFGIVINIDIYVFAIVCMVGPLGLLPSLVWENRWGKRVSSSLTQFFSSLPGSTPRKAGPVGRGWRTKLYWLLPYPIMAVTVFNLWWTIDWPEDRNVLTGTLKSLSLDQRWGMFSPKPPDTVGHCTMQATTRSGKEINLVTGEPFLDEPRQSYHYPWNYRWRAFERGVVVRRGEGHAQMYLRYLVAGWNEEHPDDPVMRARWVYYVRTIPKDYLLEESGKDTLGEYIP